MSEDQHHANVHDTVELHPAQGRVPGPPVPYLWRGVGGNPEPGNIYRAKRKVLRRILSTVIGLLLIVCGLAVIAAAALARMLLL